MKERLKRLIILLCVQICTSNPQTALAESRSIEGSGDAAMAATSRLRLQVVIPRFLYFRVGSADSTVDTISFQPLAGAVGNGSIVSGSGGDAAGGGGASVSLRSNAGQITIVANNDGGAGGLGSGGAISLTEISARSDSPELATPALTDAGGSLASVAATRGNVTDRHATWSYEYRNRHAVAPGIYSAEIIYTAVSP
jgi:hypothetical protein